MHEMSVAVQISSWSQSNKTVGILAFTSEQCEQFPGTKNSGPDDELAIT